ncbi:MASE1 domain-containing protein [Amycolatopsis japonica]|uniref:MASE1 domain-containing protein n=1 Tax=Amycolatopsis japonica TaxID=208439 RepID=UPI003403A573
MRISGHTGIGRRLQGAARWAALVAGVAGAYFLAARLGLGLALVRGQVTPLWPPTGIALASLLLFGRSMWPGILLGSFAVNILLGPSTPAVIGIAVGATAAPLLAATVLAKSGFDPALRRLRDVTALVLLGAFGGMLVSATVGSALLLMTGAVSSAEFWLTWSVWWTGDAMGVLVVTPVFLAFRTFWRQHARTVAPAKRVEAAALIVGTVVLSLGVARGVVPLPLAFFPTLIWSAWRFGLIVVAPSTLIVSIGTTAAAAAGLPPFAGLTVFTQMLVLQVINGSMALSALLLAVAAAERRQALDAATRASAELELRVRDRTAALASTVTRLERSESLLSEAQRVGHVGSWERDLTSGVIVWSDEMFRLYGLPPGTTITYTKFLDHVHPDDRAAVLASNEQAVRDHQPVEMDHRIIWPDGTVHWLHRRGRIVLDEHDEAVKMVGIAQDVTAGKIAEETLSRNQQRTRILLDAVTDAIVGVDLSGRIQLVNDRTQELFGHLEHDLLGRPVETLIPERFRAEHERYRRNYQENPEVRTMGAGLELHGLRADGSEFPAEVALRPLKIAHNNKEQTLIVAAIRDITDRRRAEIANRELQEARDRRRQALEINDNVVQGLTASIYALDCDDQARAARTLRSTLGTARQMMRDLLTENREIKPGDLVRASPASLPQNRRPRDEIVRPTGGRAGGVRLVIADDSPDVRLALRALLETLSGVEIVGEAADGAEAVRLAENTKPDAMLLDLAMPVMDGLEALPLVRSASPDTKIIVMTGYGREHIAKQALNLGAAAFVEKGGSSQSFASIITSLFTGIVSTSSGFTDEDDVRDETRPIGRAGDQQAELIAIIVHELRNPITALGSITHLLTERHDQLPSATVRELLTSMTRSLRQIDRLLRTFTDLGTMGAGNLELLLEPTDIGDLVYAVLSEHSELTKQHPVRVELAAVISAGIDPFRIRQVMSNLLSNAVKFSEAGSPITIRVAAAPDGVEIAVTDKGSGIPVDKRNRLFGKFERLGSNVSGVGIGLHISREIARAHGGDIILAESGPRGSTFVLKLPDLLAIE